MTTKDKDRFDKKFARMRVDQERFRKEILVLRRENQNAARALNQRDALVHSLPAGLMVLEKAKIVEANEFILAALGYSLEEMVAHPFADFVHPRLKHVTRDFQRRRAAGKWSPDEYETQLVTRNGETLSYDVKVRRLRRKGRTAFLMMFTPSEVRKKRENELVEAKKRESLCRMAQELIRRYIPYVKKNSSSERSVKKRAEAALRSQGPIENGNQGILRITKALESYTKETLDPSARSLIDLREVVREAVGRVGPKVNGSGEEPGTGINLKTYLRTLSPVEGDPGEIGEMLSQILSNAVEAMPRGGNLYLSIEENAGQAHIYVQDSGVGIGPEIMDRVFDPFFTTKEDGSPGLGLSVAQAIVRRHNGTLELSSKENQGTVVSIRLPLAVAIPRKRPKRRRASEVSILLVEEDGMIRDLLYKMLDHKGYRVSIVSTGGEALQQIERKTFDLVILGSRTQDITGRNLVSEIKKKNPRLRVAWITGDKAEERKSNGVSPVADLLIPKPIDMTSTLEKLSELFAG